MLQTLLEWLDEYRTVLAYTGLFSLCLLIISAVVSSWWLARLPVNYFADQQQPARSLGLLGFSLALLRNVLGITLVLLGIVMLVAPGPGIVCLVAGFVVADFPGKQKLLQWLVLKKPVFTALNWVRERSNKPPFLLPEQE